MLISAMCRTTAGRTRKTVRRFARAETVDELLAQPATVAGLSEAADDAERELPDEGEYQQAEEHPGPRHHQR
jgi:hypothetical protein